LRDDGEGPEEIAGEVELARVKRLARSVLLLAIATAALLTGLLFTVR